MTSVNRPEQGPMKAPETTQTATSPVTESDRKEASQMSKEKRCTECLRVMHPNSNRHTCSGVCSCKRLARLEALRVITKLCTECGTEFATKNPKQVTCGSFRCQRSRQKWLVKTPKMSVPAPEIAPECVVNLGPRECLVKNTHRCADCGTLTPNRRCKACWAKLRGYPDMTACVA